MKYKKFLIWMIVSFMTLAVSGQNNIDTLFHTYLNSKGSRQIALANEIVTYYYKAEYIDRPIHFNIKSPDNLIKMVLYYGMANEEFYNGRFQQSLQCGLTGIAYCPKDSIQWESDYCSIINIVFQRLGKYEQAIKYAEKGYKLDCIIGDKSNISNSLNSLAALYMANERCDVAEKYIRRAIDIERNLGRSKQLAIRLGMLSDILLKEGKTEEALPVIQEALSIDKKDNREDKVAVRMSQMADVYMAENKWAEAKKCCLEALQIFNKYDMDVSAAICLRQLGSIEMHLGHNAHARSYLLQCKELCETMHCDFLLQKVYYQLYKLYKNDNAAEALSYYEKYSVLQDSVYAQEIQKQISDFEVQYETQEKENEIVLQKEKIKQKNTLVFTFIGLAVLFIVLFMVSLRLITLQKKRNRELATINTTKDKLFSILSHDLKNPVIAQKNALEMIYQNFDQIEKEELKQQCGLLQQSAQSQYELVMMLLEWSRLQAGKMPYSPVPLDLFALAQSVIELLGVQSQQKNIIIENLIPKTYMAYADMTMLHIVLRNLLSNAIKFSYSGNHIEIEAVAENKYFKIAVIDHGVGISAEQQHQLFNILSHSREGTAGEKGTGLGLTVCKELVEKMQGSISATNNKTEGSTFSFTVKKQVCNG